MAAAIAACGLGSGIVPVALAAHAAPACAMRQLAVVLPTTEGAATQAVAFVSIRNRGASCWLDTSGSLEVTSGGTRVASIIGNPVRYRIVGTFDHGSWMLFDAWWSNWCGKREPYGVVGKVGSLSASARLNYLPQCGSPGSPSRLRGVRNGSPQPAHTGP